MDGEPSFGRWLQQRRRALDLTQAELASCAGCTANHLRNIEADRRRPSREVAERLAVCLSVEPAQRAAFVAHARGHTVSQPSASLEQLPATGADGPPEPPATSRLPLPHAPLLGRERELAELGQLLQGHVRLLTLTGPGGTGKTRLALEVAHELEAAFPDGARFVALGALADAALVPATVAAALGITAARERSLDERLIAYFATKRQLVVLDNLEHLPAAVPWIATLLQHCPTLTLLVTSRTVLHLSDEQVYPVPPLALPKVAQRNGRLRYPPPEQLRLFAAVRMFEQRARAVAPAFALGDDEVTAVAEICRRLDGLPLAIELAAARSRVLSPAAMLRRLESRLALLGGGPQDLPVRQRTLRATISWSYELLDADEQRVFACCAVFAGGFFLDAAEDVCAGAASAEPLLDVLQALVEHGLVQATPEAVVRPAALADPGPRFTMLETIREYALEQLSASGVLTELRCRHALWMCRVVETAEPELLGTDDVAWLLWLTLERDNFRAALAWSAGARDGGELSLRLGTALWRFWDIWDRREGRRWLERELERQRPAPPALRAKALTRAAAFAMRQGDLAQATQLAEAGLRLCRDPDDRRERAFALGVLGNVKAGEGKHQQGVPLWTESRELFRSAGDDWGEGQALYWLAVAAFRRREYRRAQQLWTAALANFSRSGDTPALAWTLVQLGRTLDALDEHEQAARHYQEAVQSFAGITQIHGSPDTMIDTGRFLLRSGDLTRARESFELGLRLAREDGDIEAMCDALAQLGVVARMQGNLEAAERYWQEYLALSRQLNQPARVFEALLAVGGAANIGQRYAESRRYLAEALSIWQAELPHEHAPIRGLLGLAVAEHGVHRSQRAAFLGGVVDNLLQLDTAWHPIDLQWRPRLEQLLAKLRAECAQLGLTAEWEVGRASSAEQAVAFALHENGRTALAPRA